MSYELLVMRNLVLLVLVAITACNEDTKKQTDYSVKGKRPSYRNLNDSLYFSTNNYWQFIREFTVDRLPPEASNWDCGTFKANAYELKPLERK